MSERALDVLAFIERAMDPEAPLVIDILSRRHSVHELRMMTAQRKYLKLKVAEQRALLDVLSAAIRYIEATGAAPPGTAADTAAPPSLPSPDGIRHGTLTGYTSQGCRCDACRAAMRSYQRARSARKERTELHAQELGEPHG